MRLSEVAMCTYTHSLFRDSILIEPSKGSRVGTTSISRGCESADTPPKNRAKSVAYTLFSRIVVLELNLRQDISLTHQNVFYIASVSIYTYS